MKSSIVSVTPEVAATWLGLNPELNRRLRKPKVIEYARRMLAGEWQTTHQGIAFDEKGVLLDGQHRLEAIVLAEIPVRLMVTRGAPRAAFGVLDTGVKRDLSDDLHISEWLSQPVAFLARALYCGENRSIQLKEMRAADITTSCDLLMPVLEQMHAVGARSSRDRSSAPVKCMFALRTIMNPQLQDVMLEQWRAFTLLDLKALAPSFATLITRFENWRTQSYWERAQSRAAFSWYHFDPANFDRVVTISKARKDNIYQTILAAVNELRDGKGKKND